MSKARTFEQKPKRFTEKKVNLLKSPVLKVTSANNLFNFELERRKLEKIVDIDESPLTRTKTDFETFRHD